MRKLQLIQYPASVNNVDKMIDSLGGLGTIHSAFETSDKLDLNRNRTDFLLRPVVGEIANCTGVLLKIQVKKSRRNPDKKKYVTTVAGMVEKSCTFNKFCDFQFFPFGKTNTNPELKNYSECVMPYQSLLDETMLADDSIPYLLPPPIFSRINEIRPITRPKYKKQYKSFVINIPFDSKSVPNEPTKELQEQFPNTEMNLKHLELLKRIFDERPIYGRSALCCVTKMSKESLLVTLYLVVYKFVQGPWRQLYIRYGYDPRKIPDSAIYQIIDFKCDDSSSMRLRRTNFHLVMKRSVTALAPINKVTMTSMRNNSYIFKQGTMIKNGSFIYQLCDIHVPAIQKLFNEYRLQSITECIERFGWLDEQFMLKCREIINNLIENTDESRVEFRHNIDDSANGDGVANGDEEDNELIDDSVKYNSYNYNSDSSDSFTDVNSLDVGYEYQFNYEEDAGLNSM